MLCVPSAALVQPQSPPCALSESQTGQHLQPQPRPAEPAGLRSLSWLISQQGPGTLTVCELQAGGPALHSGAVNRPLRESHDPAFTGSLHLSLIHPISHTKYITF